jgi:predicted transcriptional regulator
MARQRDERAHALGPLESEVMEIVWEAGEPLTVRDLLSRINRGRRRQLAYTTVMTVMSRLAAKGILRRRRKGRGYLYEAAVSDRAEIAVRSVLHDYGDEALTHFLEEARADPKTLRRLERLLSEDK